MVKAGEYITSKSLKFKWIKNVHSCSGCCWWDWPGEDLDPPLRDNLELIGTIFIASLSSSESLPYC